MLEFSGVFLKLILEYLGLSHYSPSQLSSHLIYTTTNHGNYTIMGGGGLLFPGGSNGKDPNILLLAIYIERSMKNFLKIGIF